MIRVVTENLVKRFDGVAVVDGASLDIRPGAITAVLGPPGAGKTVLGRLLVGLDAPDDGEIYFDGRLVGGIPPRQRGVGLVPQADALWPHLSVVDNVAYPLKVQGMPRRDRRARAVEVLGRLGVEGLAAQRPAGLVPWQARRVALARALVAKPDLLILDEPLAGLDAGPRAELAGLIDAAEVTTLVLTASVADAFFLAARLAIMDLGKVRQEGEPASVYNRPVDPFVARFLGPTNLIPGQVEATDARGDVVVRTPLGRLIGRAEGVSLAVGAAVTLSIRPEALGFGPVAPHNANRFVTTVERLAFLGATREVHLRGVNDWPLVALALQPQSLPLREGQPLTVHAVAEQVLVLPTRHAAAVADIIPGTSAPGGGRAAP